MVKKLNLIACTATRIVEALASYGFFELTHYNRGIGIVIPVPKNSRELYETIEKVKMEYLENER